MTTFSLLLKLAIVIFIGLIVAFLVWLATYDIPERKIDPDDVVNTQQLESLSYDSKLPVFITDTGSLADAVRVDPETYFLLVSTNYGFTWEIARTLEGDMPEYLSHEELPYEEFRGTNRAIYFQLFKP